MSVADFRCGVMPSVKILLSTAAEEERTRCAVKATRTVAIETADLPSVQVQPPPQASHAPATWDLVKADIAVRDATGEAKYGVRHQPHNGRDTLTDAYQEALDLVCYLRAAIYERDGK